jgi:hypothetical protein
MIPESYVLRKYTAYSDFKANDHSVNTMYGSVCVYSRNTLSHTAGKSRNTMQTALKEHSGAKRHVIILIAEHVYSRQQ